VFYFHMGPSCRCAGSPTPVAALDPGPFPDSALPQIWRARPDIVLQPLLFPLFRIGDEIASPVPLFHHHTLVLGLEMSMPRPFHQ
jgi:hypothetical protein